MLPFPEIDPIIVSMGPFHVRWYGLMYILGFAATYMLVKKQAVSRNYTRLEENFENINFVLILSVIVGGRLGYVLFYNLSYYLEHPLEIPATWAGGMSFHGACIALILAGLWYCKYKKLSFFKCADIYIVTIPIGIGLGRLGNFINGELYGRFTDVPWAMVFPHGGPIPRHPSQLYEFLLEGVFLFTLLWLNRNRPWKGASLWPHGSLLALFLCGYGVVRIIVEFFREPDSHIGYLMNAITMGQLLSSAMILSGVILWIILLKRNSHPKKLTE